VDLTEQLRGHLQERSRKKVGDTQAVECAVLIPMIDAGHGLDVIYTLRSETVSSHQGQVSFPGGKRSAGDQDLETTALRETHEEIGVEPALVDVIGRLDDVFTLQGTFVITPFVGLLPASTTFTPNAGEVSHIFGVPLEVLADPANHTTTRRTWNDKSYELPAIAAASQIIWGATLGITDNLLACIKELGPQDPA
jgi:8-oxo-dGTP pyrophosphatase MutT (NUDIX family)